jgi:hypothetical protein
MKVKKSKSNLAEICAKMKRLLTGEAYSKRAHAAEMAINPMK